jgi:hypothetical protein
MEIKLKICIGEVDKFLKGAPVDALVGKDSADDAVSLYIDPRIIDIKPFTSRDLKTYCTIKLKSVCTPVGD